MALNTSRQLINRKCVYNFPSQYTCSTVFLPFAPLLSSSQFLGTSDSIFFIMHWIAIFSRARIAHPSHWKLRERWYIMQRMEFSLYNTSFSIVLAFFDYSQCFLRYFDALFLTYLFFCNWCFIASKKASCFGSCWDLLILCCNMSCL